MSRNKREGRYAGYCPMVGHVRGNCQWGDSAVSTRCALGCVITCYEYDIVEGKCEGYYNGYANCPLGHYFFAVVQATKDGVRFGASQSGKVFTNEEERNKYIKTRVDASRKAAEKKVK